MAIEKKLALVYLVLGVAMGIAARQMDAGLAFLSAAVVYAVSVPLVRKLFKERTKTAWFVANTLTTFLLVMLVVWILAFNFW